MQKIAHSMLSLLGLHHDLDKLLAIHQASLLVYDFAAAAAAWRQFAEVLAEHADDEERDLLPLYQQRAPIPHGGTVEIFLAEHKKIRAFLKEITELVAELPADARPEPHKIVTVIEREYEFKKLLEHHDMREMNFLYPLVDRCTTREERQEILSHMRQII